jgi:hypothetical protein
MEFINTNKLHRKSGGVGHPSLVRERETAGPSASLGMTKGRVALHLSMVEWMGETAGPSASLGMTKGKMALHLSMVEWMGETAGPSASLGMTKGEGGASPWHRWRWMDRAQHNDSNLISLGRLAVVHRAGFTRRTAAQFQEAAG